MIEKYRLIERNLKLIKQLTKDGYISPKLLLYYEIYIIYRTDKDSSKLERYKKIARLTKSSVTTVRRAVTDMKSYVQG